VTSALRRIGQGQGGFLLLLRCCATRTAPAAAHQGCGAASLPPLCLATWPTKHALTCPAPTTNRQPQR
jgi:hypothetical protein